MADTATAFDPATFPPSEPDESPLANGEDLFQQLLDNVQQGEEIVDPRLGTHDGAHLLSVELAYNRNEDPVALMRWGDMVDTDGKDFEITDRVNIPTPTSNPTGHRIFLAMLHDFGVVPRNVHKPFLAHDAKAAETVVNVLNRLADKGLPWTVNISEDKQGFLRLRLRRPTKRTD